MSPDSHGRIFEVLEDGIPRIATVFFDPDSPISVAIVSETPVPRIQEIRGPSELIETRSMAEAVRRLDASSSPRKAILVLGQAATQNVPAGMWAVPATIETARKHLVEVCNQYPIGFDSVGASAESAVRLRPPAGLPALTLHVVR